MIEVHSRYAASEGANAEVNLQILSGEVKMCAHECPHIRSIFSQHLCNPDTNKKGTCIECTCILFIHQNGSIARYPFQQ